MNEPFKGKKIHFWVLYPVNSAPSQRFRVELFEPVLKNNQYPYRLLPFFDEETWRVLYCGGNHFQKFFGVFRGFFRRIYHLIISSEADYIFILREATPVGPPFFEWVLKKILGKKIIYDFDDAIWLPGGEKTTWLKRTLKATWKIKHIIRWAYKVSVGNDFLRNYAKQYNASVVLMPTVVDTEKGHHILRDQFKDEKVVVGWTGSHTTLHNMDEIMDMLPELKKETEFDFLVISNKKPQLPFDFIFQKWSAENELDDLLRMHIGLMPLKKGDWFEGKCGFKLIQYLSCGIPAVASPVGVNEKILLHNQAGFIARNAAEWKEYLKILIGNPQLRHDMGKAGRSHIEKNYSLNSCSLSFLSLFS